jgi:transposase-like protein
MVRASRETWAERVAEWQESGVSAEKFAPTIGVNPSTLRWWRTQLVSPSPKRRDRALVRGATTEATKTSVTVTPVTFVEMTAAIDGDRLEVVLPSSVRVRVRPGFDSATLAQLLDVLEARQ